MVSVVRDEIPILTEWGCFDRLTNAATAEQFGEVSGVDVQWVPGGHSWMLARPAGQRDILRHMPAGKGFVDDVMARAARIAPEVRHLRLVD